MALLVSILVVIWHIFILIFERPPTVEIVPEVVEFFNVFFRRFVIAESWDGLILAEPAFGYEYWVPELEEAAFLCLLFCWGLDVCGLID